MIHFYVAFSAENLVQSLSQISIKSRSSYKAIIVIMTRTFLHMEQLFHARKLIVYYNESGKIGPSKRLALHKENTGSCYCMHVN